MIVKADISQLKILAAQLHGADVRGPVNHELHEAAKKVRQAGRQNVRRRTGRTGQSITYSSKNKGYTYEVGPTWFVGRFLEDGTQKMPAYPFMEPAMRANTQDLPDRIAKRAADAVFQHWSTPAQLT